MSDLTAAIARLAAFRDMWAELDVIDPPTGLTAYDLDLVLEKLDPGGDNPAKRQLR